MYPDVMMRRIARGAVMQNMVFRTEYSLDNENWMEERLDVPRCYVRYEHYYKIGNEKYTKFSDAVDAQIEILLFPLLYETVEGINKELKNQSRRLKHVMQYKEVHVVS